MSFILSFSNLKIIGYSFLLCLIHMFIYISFTKGYFTFNDEYAYYKSPIAQEIEELRKFENQGGDVTDEQYEKLYKAMDEDFSKFSNKSVRKLKEKLATHTDIRRISNITIIFSFLIWPFSIFFLSGHSKDSFLSLILPTIFSLTGLLPLLNIFSVAFIVLLVSMYKNRRKKI